MLNLLVCRARKIRRTTPALWFGDIAVRKKVIRFAWFAVGKVIRNIKFATAFFVALFSPKGVCQCSAVFFVPLSQIAAAVLRRAPNIRTWLVWLLLAQKQRGCWPRSKADTLTRRSSRSLRLLGLSKAALLPSPVLGVMRKFGETEHGQ